MILVIGGTGFIGKNFLSLLEDRALRAVSVSRRPDESFLSEYAPSIEFLTVEQFHLDPAAALFECKSVVYLASNSTPGSNLDKPWNETQENIDPLLRVLQAVQTYQPTAHFIFLSSGGTVYGQVDAEVICEDEPLRPISIYGLGKRMMESSVQFMADHHGLNTTILRPANPVGRWQKSRSQGVVGVLLRSAASGAPFPMQGKGDAIRDYFDVADLCDAIMLAVERPNKSVGKTYNVGSGHGLSVRDIVGMVERVTGNKLNIKSVPTRSSDVSRVVLKTTRIEKELGWSATRKLENTVARIWEERN